ncbi:MAG: leucine-rich repeat protein, partial [Clostridia bacterium]|nr:leucine-rich repeat protein [Clostridia bacterium]
MPQCKNCGETVYEGAKFCPYCGNKLNVDNSFMPVKGGSDEDEDFVIEKCVLKKYKGHDRNIVVPDGVTYIDGAFKNCTDIISVTLPNSVKVIDECSFKGCINLENINLPDSITYIGIDAFAECNKLFYIENGIYYVDNWVILCSGNVKQPIIRQGTRGIASEAFGDTFGRSSITDIIIPNGVERICYCAFYCCKNLESVIIPDSVKYIGDEAFEECENLENIILPNSAAEISGSALYSCEKLHRRENGITYIEKWVADCDENATACIIKKGTKGIIDAAFAHRESLKSVIIPNGVKSIGENAFYKCFSLSDLIIPDSVEYIGSQAFNATNITSITIPAGIQDIEEFTFGGCKKLVEVTLPKSITNIDTGAFASCVSLTDINFEGTKA